MHAHTIVRNPYRLRRSLSPLERCWSVCGCRGVGCRHGVAEVVIGSGGLIASCHGGGRSSRSGVQGTESSRGVGGSRHASVRKRVSDSGSPARLACCGARELVLFGVMEGVTPACDPFDHAVVAEGHDH